MRRQLLGMATAALLATAPALADDHDDFLLDITQIGVKLGHHMAFREGVKAWMACYEEAGGDGEWGFWRGMDGDGISYHVVSRMDSWAELDETDEAGMKCWPTLEEQVSPHMDSVHQMFAKRMPKWSAELADNDNTVVRLYNFQVDDWQKFQAVVGSMSKILRASGYEHMGTWYGVQGGHPNDPDYFVVEGWKDFADMDNERKGVYKTSIEHAGEDGAELLWNDFREALDDNQRSWTTTLRYDEELSREED